MKMKSIAALLFWLGVALPARVDDAKKPESYQVPYRLSDTKHVIVRAKINGKGPFNLVVDTGAPAFYLSKIAGKKLGLQADKDGWTSFDRFELEGGLVVPKAKGRLEDIFQIEGMNGMGVAGIELHGLLGYSILAQYRIEVDFTRDKMTWTRLDFAPEMPQRFGGKGAPPALDAMGSVLKVMGTLLGKKAEPEILPRGFLGVEVLERDGTVEVKSLVPDGPAARGGLKVGDRIKVVEDRDIETTADFHKAVRKVVPGDTISITVLRNKESKDITLAAGKGL